MNVPINVYIIARTAIEQPAIDNWIRSHGAMPVYGDTDCDTLVGLAAKRCYKSFDVGINPNVTRVRADWGEYIDNILASGHGSVLEHATYTFAIENVSRVFTGELNRHRAGVAISEGSMRYIRFDSLDYWLPPSADSEMEAMFASVFEYVSARYRELVARYDWDKMDFGEKKKLTSLFRRLVPMGVATGGVWTFNMRALRHVITTRCSAAAEEEICHVFSRIGKLMVESEPLLFGDFESVDGFWVPKWRKV